MLVSTNVTSVNTATNCFLLRSFAFFSFLCLAHVVEPSFLIWLIGDGFAVPIPIFLIIVEY